MTEAEYIYATILARIWEAERIVRDCGPFNLVPEAEAELVEATKALSAAGEHVHQAVQSMMGDDDDQD